MEKTSFFNLIVLDESGSMNSMRAATIEGCNSVINAAREVQAENTDTQHSLMSIYAFQSGYSERPSRYLIKHQPVAGVADLTEKDYRPWGGTPLYDAVGETLTELDAVASTHVDATGIITIITDGMENSSTRFSHADCVRLIDRFKEMGWAVNFIGANIDVEKVSAELHIDNRVSFHANSNGMRNIMADMVSHSKEFMNKEAACCKCNGEIPFDPEERLRERKKRAARFFKHDSDDDIPF